MRTNLKDVDDKKEFEPVPTGWYQVKVVQADKKQNDGKAPFISTRFKIVVGEHCGRLLFHNFIFTEKALPFMKPFLIAIGYPEDKEVEIDHNEWVEEGGEGTQLMVFAGTETYNSKPKNKITFFESLESAGKSPVVADDSFPGS